MRPHQYSLDKIKAAKYAKILDLMRRATANGTHEEVARAIAEDWFPLMRVDEKGVLSFKIDRVAA
jgi:hypothetical protein